MTINAQTGISDVMLGDGVNLVFPFDFKVGGSDELVVYVDGVSVNAADYSVDLSDDWTGDITFDTAPADGAEVVIVSDPDFVQSSVHQRPGPFFPDIVEDDLDRATLRDIYLKRGLTRSLRAPEGEPLAELPNAADRANSFLAFGDDGAPLAAVGDIPSLPVTSFGASLIAAVSVAAARVLLGVLSAVELVAATGASLIGTSQAETGAVNVLLQTLVRKLGPVYPEQFGAVGDGVADDTIPLQRAIDAAGNWSSAGFARVLMLTRWYKTTAPLKLRPYVPIHGVGRVRCGIKPTLSSGVALSASNAAGAEGTGDVVHSGWGIDCVNCTGSAQALYVEGFQSAMWQQIGIFNCLTTSYPLELAGNSYGHVFDQLLMRNCNLGIRCGTGAGSFTTTNVFRVGRFETGPQNTGAWVLLEDCNSTVFNDRCVFQGLNNIETIKILGGATRSTSHSHIIRGNYFEANGNNQAGHNTLKIVGVSANKVDNVVFDDNDFHGFGGGGGHVSLAYTRFFRAVGNNCAPGQKFVTDAGNNSEWDIDATRVGLCDLQSIKYSETIVVFDDLGAIVLQDGPIPVTVSRQAVGTWYLNTSRAWTAIEAVVAHVDALSTSYKPMDADAYPSSVTRLEVHTYSGTGTVDTTAAPSATAPVVKVLTDPLRVKVRIMAKLVALP